MLFEPGKTVAGSKRQKKCSVRKRRSWKQREVGARSRIEFRMNIWVSYSTTIYASPYYPHCVFDIAYTGIVLISLSGGPLEQGHMMSKMQSYSGSTPDITNGLFIFVSVKKASKAQHSRAKIHPKLHFLSYLATLAACAISDNRL